MKITQHLILKKGSTIVLRIALAVIGLIVLALCVFALPAIWRGVPGEYPSITYVFYIILLGLYISALPFFIALWQATRILNYIDSDTAFSLLSVKALRLIAWCGFVISLVFAALLPFMYIWAEKDDAPGLIIIGMFMTLAPLVVTVFAAVIQRLLGEAIAIKIENELTV